MENRKKPETVKFRLTISDKEAFDNYCKRNNIKKQDLFEQYVLNLLKGDK